MRHILFVFLVLVLCVQVHSRQNCRHKVRTPTKCHEKGTCILYARLTPAANSTLFYCCKQGYRSTNNECVDVDECAASPKPCEDICTNHPGSYSCGCREGFRLVDATQKCEKVSSCTHLNCTNSCFYDANGPLCDCPRGFTLHGATNCTADPKLCPTGYHEEYDSHTCRVIGEDPQMMIAYDGQVYRYTIRKESDILKLIKVEGSVNSIYFDSEVNKAYFAGDYLTAVSLGSTVRESRKHKLSSPAVSMAVDYVGGHIYVLDEASLGLWSINGGEPELIGTLMEHNGTMTRVAVDPGNAWLFYTASGQVVKARLDGQKFTTIFNFYSHVKDENIETEAFAVDDMDRNELFLFYGINRHIFTFAIDGRQLLWVTDSLPGNVLYMDVFEDFIYYTMDGISGLTVRTKDGLKAPVVHFEGEFFHALHIRHRVRQSEGVIFHCDKRCAHLCFRDLNDYPLCACTRDYVLAQDKASCTHANGTVHVSPLGTPSAQIDSWDDDTESLPITTTTTVSANNGFLVVACVLLVSICVVQSLLIWWFYPRRRFQQGMGASFAARFHDSGSCVALDSVGDTSEH